MRLSVPPSVIYIRSVSEPANNNSCQNIVHPCFISTRKLHTL